MNPITVSHSLDRCDALGPFAEAFRKRKAVLGLGDTGVGGDQRELAELAAVAPARMAHRGGEGPADVNTGVFEAGFGRYEYP